MASVKKREEKLRELSNVSDDVPPQDLEDFEDAKTRGKFVAGRSSLKSVMTPVNSMDEGSYEAAAVLYAASACDVRTLGVIYGAGRGSTQISAVQDGALVGTSFYELGSKKGVEILNKSGNKKDCDSLKAAVEEWGKVITNALLKDWKMSSSNPNNSDIEGKKSTDFLKEHSKNKTVVGISAVFYSMSGTEEMNQINKKNDLPRIEQRAMVAALKKKLDDLLSFTFDNGEYKTASFKPFNEKKFLTELANVKLNLIYAEMLFDETATFILAREWKVHGKPFRTTWTTGWYVTHLPLYLPPPQCLLY
jgi:hypothetical protein